MEHIQQSPSDNDSAASCWQSPVPDLLSFTYRDCPSHHLITSWTSNETEMSKSLATPILHFAQAAQLNNQPSVLHPFNCKLIGRSMFPFLGLFRHFCKQGFQLWFFFSLPNYYIYGEAAYSEVPHLKATHGNIATHSEQDRTCRAEMRVTKQWGSEWPHKSPGCPLPEGREEHKEPAIGANAPLSPCTLRVK